MQIIHVHTKNGPHEWLTQKEYEAKYGQLEPSNGPYYEQGRKLAELRKSDRVTLRELSKVTDMPMKYLCDLEHGREKITPQIEEAYQKGLLTVNLSI